MSPVRFSAAKNAGFDSKIGEQGYKYLGDERWMSLGTRCILQSPDVTSVWSP